MTRVVVDLVSVERSMPIHTEEVTGSIPVSPTACFAWSDGLLMIFIGRPSVCLGSRRGAGSARDSLSALPLDPIPSALTCGKPVGRALGSAENL
jgi:hypothetical protein